MLKHLSRILAYFVLAGITNYCYRGSSVVLQGPIFIVFWGTWLGTNKDWPFAQKYGAIFNWAGLAACLNGLYFLFTAMGQK